MWTKYLLLVLPAVLCIVAEDRSKPGSGLIGYGISMYKPLCPTSCRTALAYNTLKCSTTIITDSDGHKLWATTTPDCYAEDDAFLTTIAWCINRRCLDMEGWEIERYWEESATGDSTSHRRLDETGVSVSTNRPAPKWTYQEALDRVSQQPATMLFPGDIINDTSVIGEEFYTLQYNTMAPLREMKSAMRDTGKSAVVRSLREAALTRHSLILIIFGLAVPTAISSLRLFPLPSSLRSKFYEKFIDPPLLGPRHKEPFLNLAIMPTRGQSFLIAYILIINTVLSAVGYYSAQPNAWWASTHEEILTQVGNRVGVLSFANASLTILYAGRNNFLYWLTNWSQSTFILLHRWTAYICSLQAILHSIIWLQLYLDLGRHSSESKLPYWYWGIIATLAFAIILPASSIPLRKKMFELFLASHIILTIFALVGSYLHIVYRFEHQWGYELWIYMAFAVWGFDRLLRIIRVARNGLRWAHIIVIDENYLQLEVPGAKGNGHAYLYFPTLTWRFWENHPFCIASTALISTAAKELPLTDSNDHSDDKSMRLTTRSASRIQIQPGLLFFLRTYKGATSLLRHHSRLPVFVEAGYLDPHYLSEYSKIVCIVGGVAFTSVTSLASRYPSRTKLYWSCRSAGLVRAVEPILGNVERNICVGTRHDISQVVEAEALDGSGPMAVVVSGPAGLLDEVRCTVVRVGWKSSRSIRLIDDQYIW